MSNRRQDSRTRRPDRTRVVLWGAFAIGVLAAARGTYEQTSHGVELSSILLLSLANAVATGGLFALVAAVAFRAKPDRRH